MTIWKVSSKYYGNGYVKAKVTTLEADEVPKGTAYFGNNLDGSGYEEYEDYFTNGEEAQAFYISVVKAP